MGLLGEDPAPALVQDVVGDVRAAREAVHEAAEGHAEQRRARHRASGKTRKSAETRRRIMEAASALMAERGDTGFQMSEVSELCGMSKGALYYYFADRDELVEAIYSEVMDEMVSSLAAMVERAPSAHDALHDVCAEMGRRLSGGSPLALAMTNELANARGNVLSVARDRMRAVVDLVSGQLERAKGEGIVRPDVDSGMAAVYAVGGFLMASLAAVNFPVPWGGDDLAAELVSLTLRGIGTEGASI